MASVIDYQETHPLVSTGVPDLKVPVRRREWSLRVRTWTLTVAQQAAPIVPEAFREVRAEPPPAVRLRLDATGGADPE